jgi:hypothetical protein
MQDATNSWGFLAGLELVNRGKISVRDRPRFADIQEAWRQVVRSVIEAFRGGVSAWVMLSWERTLGRKLREIGRLFVEHVVNRIEPEDERELPQHERFDGEVYRRKTPSPLRNLNCTFGPIALKRCLYQPLESSGRCLFPLERRLGIVGGVATPALADEAAQAAADQPQRQVLDGLKERHGVCWSAQTLRKVVVAVDELYTPQRHEAQVERLLGWLRVAEKSSGRHTPVLSVGRDGIMLPIVARDKYQEGSTATVAVYDRRKKRLGTIYLGQMPESGQAALSESLTRLLTDVLTRWDGLTPKLNYVTDGGHHPTEYFETVLSLMPDPRRSGKTLPWEWIVDYYHACQYITLLAEALFGPGRAAFAWAKKQRQVMKTKEGGVFRILRSAGALRTTRGLVGSAEDYFRGYRYLHDRAAKMNYAAALRRGLPIGSGVTEAGCKTLFTQRFKQSGMKWTVTGGQPILNLRTISLSRVWSAVRDRAWQSYEIPQPLTHTAKPNIKSHKPRKLAV